MIQTQYCHHIYYISKYSPCYGIKREYSEIEYVTLLNPKGEKALSDEMDLQYYRELMSKQEYGTHYLVDAEYGHFPLVCHCIPDDIVAQLIKVPLCNKMSIGIQGIVNGRTDNEKLVSSMAELTANTIWKYNIPTNHIYTEKMWSCSSDDSKLLNLFNGSFESFIKKVTYYYNRLTSN